MARLHSGTEYGSEPEGAKVPILGADSPVWGCRAHVLLPPSPGGISKGSCEPCPAGSFCPSLGLSYPTGSCVAGSECPLDIVASSPMALPCPQVPPQELREGAQSPSPPTMSHMPLRSDLSAPSSRPQFLPHLPHRASRRPALVITSTKEAQCSTPPEPLGIPTMLSLALRGATLSLMPRVTSASQELLGLPYATEGGTSPHWAQTPVSDVHLAFTARIPAP